MLRFAKNSLLLLLLLVLADRLTGTMLEYFFYRQHHGDDYITMQVLDSTRADIIVMGSSRASHHYIPDTIEAYSGLTCFNGGRDNMGIHYTRACLRQMLERYQPKYVVLDLIPYNFILDNQHNQKYFDVQSSVLQPFASRHPLIYEDIAGIDPWEVWKNKCIKTYAFNSLAGSIVQNAFTHIGHAQVKGYEPLKGAIDPATYGKQVFSFTPVSKGIDTGAFRVLEDCLRLCQSHSVKVVLCFSPFYFTYHPEAALLERYQTLAAQYGAMLLDYSAGEDYTGKANLFYDELHLNDEGARMFSVKLADEIRRVH